MTPEIMAPLFALSSSEATKRQFPLELAITSTTPCIYPMGWVTTMFGVLTEMR
jgi:hypothetical protein